MVLYRSHFLVHFLLITLQCVSSQLVNAAPVGSPPNNARVIAAGHVPHQCTEADGAINTSGATYGYYWSDTANAWLQAPYCYARWGYLQASASQIVSPGSTVTVTAMPDDSRMAGLVAKQGGMSWSYPGTLVSGCGTKDVTCTVKIGDEDSPPTEWAWYQFHVSGPGRVFILPPSYAPRCQESEPCLDTRTNAWSYVGIAPEDDCEVPAKLVSNYSDPLKTSHAPLAANVCKTLGLNWEMPSIQNRITQAWSTKDGVIPSSEVHPKNYQVDLLLKNGTDEMKTCPSTKYYKWTIKSKATPVKTYKTGSTCREPIFVDKEGQYLVSVEELKKKDNKKTGRGFQNREITVQDWLIVGMGDSNGSGQGTANEGVPYDFVQCDRGSAAYQSLVAQGIEEADKKTSVTFIHTACSGARTVHLHSKSYAGQEVNLANKLAPQIKQLSQRLKSGKKKREVDALILSIGINDVMFGGILGTCIGNSSISSDCQSIEVEPYNDPKTGGEPNYRPAAGGETLDVRSKRLIKNLPKVYAPVAESLAAAGIMPKRVFITNYPEATTAENKLTCDGSSVIGFTQSDWVWLGQLGLLLNKQVNATMKAHGWTPITEIPSLFVGRGVCAANSLFQTLSGSAYTQGNIYGTFHSKREGHGLMAGAVMKVVCKQMYGNEKCEGNPRKPQVQ